jgi:hypothetical protein
MTINGASKLRDTQRHRNASTIRDLDKRNSLLTKERDLLHHRIKILKFQRYPFFVLGASVVYLIYVFPSFLI